MLPILNADQVRNMDAHTMINEPITSVELMERAATACAHRIIEQLRNGAFGAQDAASFLLTSAVLEHDALEALVIVG
jgi:NAD(P)H-hydrate repair Nnr-like enzyme with NAD(P)H-hydrate epimerase domain